MTVQADLNEAIESGRDDLIRVLAKHRLLPAVVEGSGGDDSGLLGKSATPTFRLDSQTADASVVDRQTTAHVVDTLGLDSAEACEAVREEIQAHSAWGED